MKKIYLMGLTAAFAMSVNAQSTIKLKSTRSGELKGSSIAKGGSVLSPMQITGGITCNTQYVAGTSQNLEFTIDLTNTDSEYGDMVTLTFPAGITPNATGHTASIGTSSGGAEMLNPVAGQVVSWGDNDNSFGGIQTGTAFNFTVSVTIGAGVTGNQNVSYDISGDTYGSAPGDLTGGTAIVYPVGASVVNMQTKLVAPSNITALNNCAIGTGSIIARVVNLGTNAESNIPANYSVNGVASTSIVIPGPIAPGDSVTFAFPATYNFNASSMYNVKAWVAQTGESAKTNDTASINFSNTIPTALTNTATPYVNGFETAYDQGSVNLDWTGSGLPFGLSATAHTGTRALFYTVNMTTVGAPAGTYESFINLPCTDLTLGDTYRISYWKKSATSGTLTINGQSAILTGTAQTGADMTTVLKPYSAITTTSLTGASGWVKDSVDYVATATETRYFAIGGKGTLTTTADQINVRVDDIKIWKVAGGVGIKTISSNEVISIFPNPTSGILNINAIEVNSSIEVYNVVGDKVYTSSLVKGNNTIDLSSLANGAYFVKLNSNNQIITKKVVLSK